MELDIRTAAIIALREAGASLDSAKTYVLQMDQNHDVQTLGEAIKNVRALVKELGG